jgi:hypothetical protein
LVLFWLEAALGNLFLLLWFCFWLKAALGNIFLLLWFCFWLKAALGGPKQHWGIFFSSRGSVFDLFLLLVTLSLKVLGLKDFTVKGF